MKIPSEIKPSLKMEASLKRHQKSDPKNNLSSPIGEAELKNLNDIELMVILAQIMNSLNPKSDVH